MSVVDKLTKKFGANLSESLGVRTQPAALSGPQTVATVSPDDGRTRQRETGLMEIDRIVPDPNQPRKEFDGEALDRLSESLKRHGQLLPVRVRWSQDLSKWVIISGERRYQAASRAGLKMLACVFVDRALTESELLQEQIIENMLREDLKPVEQATAYKTLMELQGWNGAQLAGALNISHSTVTRAMALLKLPDDVQRQVDRGVLPPTAAYEVAKLPTDTALRQMADRIVTENLSRSEAADAVRVEVSRVEREATVVEPAVKPLTPPAHERSEIIAPTVQVDFHRANSEPSESESDVRRWDNEVQEPQGSEAGQGGVQKPTLMPQEDPQGDDLPETAHRPAPAKKKPGRPRSGSKEQSFRVDGAKVVVTFAKKVPEAGEIIAALEQALEKARLAVSERAEAA